MRGRGWSFRIFHSGDTTIPVWAGPGRIVGGQLLSMLTSREDDNNSQRCGEYRALSKHLYTYVTLSQSESHSKTYRNGVQGRGTLKKNSGATKICTSCDRDYMRQYLVLSFAQDGLYCIQ